MSERRPFYELSPGDHAELSRRAARELPGWLRAETSLPIKVSGEWVQIGQPSSNGRGLNYGAWYVALRNGTWVNHKTGERGGVVRLLQVAGGLDYIDAVDVACEMAGFVPESVQRAREKAGRRHG